MQIFSVIFDMDGVMIDSAEYHQIAWHRIAAELGREFPAGVFEKAFGLKNPPIINGLLNWATDAAEIDRIADRKESLYRDLIRERGLPVLEGLTDLLRELHAGGIMCAVGSSAPRDNVTCLFENSDLQQYFQAVVTGDDVTHGKPDPEIFLQAAQKLNVPPQQCIVIEDALAGIQAAKAAGMFAVAITSTHPRASFTQADRIVDQLSELSVGWFQDNISRAAS